MKKCFKKIAVMVLAVMIFSALASYVSASAELVDVSKFTTGLTYNQLADPRWKQNATDVVVELHNSGFAGEYRIRAMGCSSSGADAVNYTYYNYQRVDYVTCNRGTIYSIDTTIYENDCDYAMLSVYPIGGSGTTTGQWSPDSLQTFKTPESAG